MKTFLYLFFFVCSFQVVAVAQTPTETPMPENAVVDIIAPTEVTEVTEVKEDSSVGSQVADVGLEELPREDVINQEVLAVPSEGNALESAEPPSKKEKERIVLGWVEPILLGQKGLSLDAKLTPGTAGNSLHAENIVMEEKANKTTWVDFDITDKLGRTVRFHKKVISMRKKKNPQQNQYKVNLGFCLNFQHFELDFIVGDRSDFEHTARIGRDSLAGHYIIDPGLTKTSTPSCK